MKNKKIARYGIILLAALFAWGMAACSSGDDNPPPAKGTGALLTSLKIADGNVTLPSPMNTEKWDSYTTSFSGLEPEYIGDALVPSDEFLQALVIVATASSGAKISYATATGNSKPPETDFAAAKPTEMYNGASLYIKVVSEDARTTNYYRVRVNVAGSSADLTRITVAGANAMMGDPSGTWAGVTAGSVNMSSADKDNVPVAIQKASALQQVSFARVPKADAGAEPSSWTLIPNTNSTTVSTTALLAADEDLFCFKVVAENGETTQYYIVEIRMGHDATLGTLTIGTVNASDFGTPAATWDAGTLVVGEFLGTEPVPGIGMSVVIAPSDSQAAAEYAYVDVEEETTEPSFAAVPTDTLRIHFATEGYLYIRITSEYEDATLVYKIHAEMQQRAEILYGMPEIRNNYIDPIWADVEATYEIKRLYPGDTTNQEWALEPDTWGVAKALWDDDGLYVYWDVTDPTRAVANNEHTDDSVELFINEAYTRANGTHGTYGQGGSQYRVRRDGFAAGGDPDAAVTAFRNLGKYVAWNKSGNLGYVVMMQVPWRFKSGANKAFMFDDDGLLKLDMEFGFELQINACYPAGTRLGTLCWNNSATSNYQNAANFGVATLTLGDKERVKKAEMPQITGQPRGATYYEGQDVTAVVDLSVTVSQPYSGTLSYQWWSATTDDGAGAALGGKTDATLTPGIGAKGSTWYWVVVTNTDTTADSRFQATSTTSTKAKIMVVDEEDYIGDYFLNWDGVPKRSLAMAASSNYTSAIVIELPEFDITRYTHYTFVIKLYAANGTTEVTPIPSSTLQMKWRSEANATIGADVYNMGQQNGTNSLIPEAVLTAGNVAKLDFETSSSANWTAGGAAFVEIVSIRFYNE
jgi:hypothetical protein